MHDVSSGRGPQVAPHSVPPAGRRHVGAILLAGGLLLASLAETLPAAAQSESAAGEAPRPLVRMDTDAGPVLLVLFPDLAPNHVAQFLHLTGTGFYEGTYFHRLVPGFVIQGGDPNTKDRDPRNDGVGGPALADVLGDEAAAALDRLNTLLAARGYAPLRAEANLAAEFSQRAKHGRGSLSMARARDPDSAGSQFFICVAPTPQLDGQYTLFGQVVDGMDVVDAIVSAPTDPARGREQPAEPVHITSLRVVAREDLTPAEQDLLAAVPDPLGD
ncbi:MAG: peptidylprolyl isomerase [Candidatus Krumholzibacteriia bacterium]